MKELTGTGWLIRLILRRDRIALIIWVLVVSFIPMTNALSFTQLYPTQEAIQAFVEESESNPAIVFMFGQFPSASIGGITAWRSLLQVAIFMAIPSLLLVVRHTRTDEMEGRGELLASTVVGRYASLTAALTVVFGMNILIGIIMSASLIGAGLSASGAIIMAFSLISAGLMFAAIAALTAQLYERPSSAISYAFLAMGIFMALRFTINIGELDWLGWFSPFTWLSWTGAFGNQQIWVFLLVAAFIAIVTIAAYVLSAQRDFGGSIIQNKSSGALSSPSLDNPFALAWRLQSDSLISWTIIAAVIGTLLGGTAQYMRTVFDTDVITGWLSIMGVENQGDAMLIVFIYIVAMLIPLYSISAVLQLWDEEKKLRAEPLLALPLARLRWAFSHLIFAYGGALVILTVFGLAIGLVYGISTESLATALPQMLTRTLATLPAIWVMSTIAVFTYGFLPRFASPISWGAFVAIIFIEIGWELQLLSQSIFNISPFAHAHWTTSTIQIAPLLALLIIAFIFVGIGLLGLQHRDIG